MNAPDAAASPTKKEDPSPAAPYGGAVGLGAAAAIFSAALTMAETLPGRTEGLGVVTKPLLEEFVGRMSEVDWGTINLVATLLGSLFCFPCGWMVDRWGARPVGTLCALLLGGTTLAAAGATSPWELAVYLTLTRGVGQSMLSVVSLATIGKAFPRRPRMAMASYAVLLTMLMAVSMGVLMHFVEEVGWRQAWSGLGWGVLASAPLVWLVTPKLRRTTPEEAAAADAALRSPDPGSHATWPQALATPCFWTFALSISFFAMVNSGVSLFLETLLEERGLDNAVFQKLKILGLGVGLTANLVGGWLAMKFRLETLLGAALLLMAAALAYLPRLQTLDEAYLYCVLYSAGGGMLTVLFFSVWSQAFGARDLARIQGLAQMLTVAASAAGPAVLAQSRATSGGSIGIMLAFAAVFAALGLVSFFVRVPSAADGAWAAQTDESLRTASQPSA